MSESIDHVSTSKTNRPSLFRSPLVIGLVVLDVLVIGGMIALGIVYSLLNYQIDVYGTQNMVAVSVLLDFMDDLLLPTMSYVTSFLVLTLAAFVTWAWMIIERQGLRYTVVALLIVILLVATGTLLFRGKTSENISPMTPTPIAKAGID